MPSPTKFFLSLALIFTLVIAPVSITLAQDSEGDDEGKGEGEGGAESAPDADGDGQSDAAESAAAAAAAANVNSAVAISGVDVSIGAIDTTKDPEALGGASVSVNGVSMSVDAALSAIGDIADAKANGVNQAANTTVPGIDTAATLAAHAQGERGVVVGSMSGVHGTPSEVADAEAEYAGRAGAVDQAITSLATQQNSTESISSKDLTEALSKGYQQYAESAKAAGITNLGGTTRTNPDGTAVTQSTINAYQDYANTMTQTGNTNLSGNTNNSNQYSITPGNNLTVEARMAAAGFNPDGSVQRAVTIDYANLMTVTSGRVSDYQENDTLDSKIAMEQNMISLALNSNIDQTELGQVNRDTIENYGKVDNRDTNGSFAKSFDKTIAPSLWSNSNIAGRYQLGTSYLSNIVGYTPKQAAGIMGNFKAESNLDNLEEAAGSERSSGLAQWNAATAAGARRQALEAYAGVEFSESLANGKHTSGPGALTQISFAVAEIKGIAPGHRDPQSEAVGRTFENNPDMTSEQTAKEFQNGFERPNDKTHSLGARQHGANEALEAYNEINPNQQNFTANVGSKPTNQEVAQETNSNKSATQLSVNLGGVTITVDTSKVLGALDNLMSGLLGNKNNTNSKYTSLPTNSEGVEEQNLPVLEQINITPGRPDICPAGAVDEGFAFTVKFSNQSQYDHAHSCKGKSTADYFTVVTAYLRGYGINDIQEAEVMQKMHIANP